VSKKREEDKKKNKRGNRFIVSSKVSLRIFVFRMDLIGLAEEEERLKDEEEEEEEEGKGSIG
jgi:hypothetical protein